MGIWKTKWGWRAEFMLNGQRVPAQGFFRYKDEARRWIKEEKERCKLNPIPSSSPEIDLSYWVLAQRYLQDAQINFSYKTLSEKRACLERFYKHIGDVIVTDITPPNVLDFINKRASQKSGNSANKDRKNLKAFYRWLQDIYGVMHDPTAPIRQKPYKKHDRRLIPIQDVLKVLLAAQGEERNLIAAYWHTGARKGEVLRWTWAEDVNFEERWIRLGTQKTGNGSMHYERIWMNDDLFAALMDQWKKRGSSPYVFPSYYSPNEKGDNWKGEQRAHRLLVGYRRKKSDGTYAENAGLCQKAGVEHFGFHDIRHTVAKYLNDIQKVGLKKVQQVLRHRRQTTTEIYLEGNYTDTREAVALLEVRNLENFR